MNLYNRFIRISGWIIIILIPVFLGFLSINLGRDINWDFRNYHYYNAYAFLNHRLNFDVAPAQLQTYINPILDVPFYWLSSNFHAITVGFIMGFVHGLDLVLLFFIFWEVAQIQQRMVKFTVGIFLMIISGWAPGYLSELGTTMNDNLTALFVLCALLLIIKGNKYNTEDKLRSWLFFIIPAGLIMGIGVGLKESIAFCAVASAISIIFLGTKWKTAIIGLGAYGLSGILGVFTSSGVWFWKLWNYSQNPIFPFFNSFFKSPLMVNPIQVQGQFKYHNLLEFLTWPIVFSLNSLRVSQIKFTDFRFALLYLLIIGWLITLFIRKIRSGTFKTSTKNNPQFLNKESNSLLIFVISGFIIWIFAHNIYRYLIPLELLVPLCIFILLEKIITHKIVQNLILVAICLSLLFSVHPGSWGRIKWETWYLRVTTYPIAVKSPNGALVVMIGHAPTAYVIPQFPQNFQFVRPESNFFMQPNDGLFLKIKDIVSNYKGDMYLLYSPTDDSVDTKETLSIFGMKSIGTCQKLIFNARWQNVILCDLVK